MKSLLCGCMLLFGGLVSAKKPNILMILSDDQDNHMNTLDHMEAVQKHLIKKGTTRTHHYCTTALCCPSRATLWTGRTAHNTNVTDVRPPYGGYTQVVREGINDDYLPIWMQDAGYNTYYIGKLWNAYGMKRYDDPPARGWTGSDILMDPSTYRYYDAWMSHNGEKPTSYEGQYSPDVVAHLSSKWLDEAMDGDKPWMLIAAPVAPHAEVVPAKKGKWKKHAAPPPAAPRHQHKFENYQIPRGGSFNPDEITYGASWVKTLPQLEPDDIEYNDNFQRRRLQALMSVDDMVDDLVSKLEDAGQMDNTYVIYTTDNGFHISQHRMHPGKQCAYETDINIPFIIRGPGIEKGARTDLVSAHTDIAPTFLSLAGQDLRDDFDGHVMVLTKDQMESNTRRHEHTQAEFWGNANTEGRYNYEMPRTRQLVKSNTYKAIRLVGEGYNLFYSVWCTNERELYDMTKDPHQLHNLFDQGAAVRNAEFSIANRPFEMITHRLDALTMVLKTCKGPSCRNPWEQLHPNGKIKSLTDALHSDLDTFYKNQPRIAFKECTKGYFPALEGPRHYYSMGESDAERERKEKANYEALPAYLQQDFQYPDADNSHEELELRRRALEILAESPSEFDTVEDVKLRRRAMEVLDEEDVDLDEELDPFDDDIGTFLDGDMGMET